jgi:5-methylcytosine-specific restriction protein A
MLGEQRNFSRGFNQIRDKIVLENLQKLWKKNNILTSNKIISDREKFIENFGEQFSEGQAHSIVANVFERNARARAACLRHHDFSCKICDFDFEKVYGDLGRNFIHVHHLKSLSKIRKGYKVDPIKDLWPVCPNCHAILHRKTPALKVSELKSLIENLRAPAPLR